MRLVNYFLKGVNEDSGIVKIKAKLFVWFSFIIVGLILFFLVFALSSKNEKSVMQIIGLPSLLSGSVIGSLLVLRYKGIRYAGNMFTLLMVLFQAYGVASLGYAKDSVHSFTGGFYLLFSMLTLSALFGTKLILVINFLKVVVA